VNIGSLFSGYGGLDLAVEEVHSARTVWHSELDPNASKVLEQHWPGVPNLGDITKVQWADVEPVDILTGGFPCQDISTAGLGRGITEGTRSGLWYFMADAVRHLRPSLVVVENVSALLVRGIDIVLGDLADIGYDAQWVSVRASDVGAPHRRERIFLTAHPKGSRRADEPIRGDAGRLSVGPVAGTGRGDRPGDPAPGVHRDGRPARLVGAAPLAAHVGHERPGSPRGRRPGSADGGRPAPDAGSQRHGRRQDVRVVGRGGAPAEGGGRDAGASRQVTRDRGAEDGGGWGPYAAAIHRWEPIVGRAAPLPTDDRGRLSPVFVEWMMGLPAGWVTDHLDRRPALKALGNGVVPQQAAHALHQLDSMRCQT
jgi:DNA (cytosine-5)-methyltransferase 1